MGMNKITNGLPTVRLATTENLTTDITGHALTPAKLDGVTVTLETPGTPGDEILVKDQVDASQNGTWIAGATVLHPMTRRESTFDPESVVRVSEGDRNAHTAWALTAQGTITVNSGGGGSDLPFVRQDVKHYSCDSISELKTLWQVLPNATATVAGYYAPGDKGGGDFTFVAFTKVTSANPKNISITKVTDVDGLVTITAKDHGLGDPDNPDTVTTAYIDGVDGLPSAVYFVKVVGTDSFTLGGYITGVSLVGAATVQYVSLVTKKDHGRTTGQRISVVGVVNSGGAPDIRHVIDTCGVIDKTTLSLPIPNDGTGMYEPGTNALIGDDGLLVPAGSADGTVGGLWKRARADHLDVRWFGAVGNWDPTDVFREATDDLPAFNAAIAAFGSDVVTSFAAPATSGGTLRAQGNFYLSDTLHITKNIVLSGSGNNSVTTFWRPGTVLAFPADKTGIRIHSMYREDSPDGGSGNQSVIRDLIVHCIRQGDSGHGIHISAAALIENVNVENFGGHGIAVIAKSNTGVDAGNAGGWEVSNCSVYGCGGDGVHVIGADASTGLVVRTSSSVNTGYGFYDESGAGNTYIALHAQGNHIDVVTRTAVDYKTVGGTNCSILLGCYSEQGDPDAENVEGKWKITANQVAKPSMIIGGEVAAHSVIDPDSNAFVFGDGTAFRAPVVHENVKGTTKILVQLGGSDKSMTALTFSTPDRASDHTDLTFDAATNWWTLQNVSRTVMSFPTTIAPPRRVAPLFGNGIFYGSAIALGKGASAALINHVVRTEMPTDDTWEKGDVVWNSAPAPGGPIGWVCTTAGTQGKLIGVTGTVDAEDGTVLVVSDLTNLVRWQYVKIAGVDIRQIVSDTVHPPAANTVILDSAATLDAAGAIYFSPPTFATMGVVGRPVRPAREDKLVAAVERVAMTSTAANYSVVNGDFHVDCTAGGITVTLPATPVDGESYEVKDANGEAGGAAITVNGNGNNIDGSGSQSISTNFGFIRVRFSSNLGTWVMV
jgi:hypothetical protein